MESKQRLRPWLEAQINSGEIPGLCWLNAEKTKFRIPWKHGGKQDWNPESGEIFKEWARHTGRFREGIDTPDYVKWKTRLRCAFNKAPDIIEVKDESQLECPDPFRVYVLKPRKNGKKTSETETKPMFDPVPSCAAGFQKVLPPLPAVLDDLCVMSTGSLPSDLKDMKSEDILLLDGATLNLSANAAVALYDDDIQMLSDNFRSLDLKRNMAETSGSAGLILKIFYNGNEVLEKVVPAPLGCRLYYNTCSNFPLLGLPQWFSSLMYEENRIENLHFPPCQNLMGSTKLEGIWQVFLEKNLSEGFCIAIHDDDVYALQLCNSPIFYASDCGTLGNPVQLERQLSTPNGTVVLTKIFDYKKDFLPAFNQYVSCQSLDPPSPTVYLIVGTGLPLSELQQGQVIYCSVTSSKALEALQKLQEQEQFISSDEKFADAILNIEAEIKTEPKPNTLFGEEWIRQSPPTAIVQDNYMLLSDDFFRKEFIIEETPSTLAFDDLLKFEFDP